MHEYFTAYLESLSNLHEDLSTAIAGLPLAGLEYIPGAGMNSLTVLISHTAGAERYWIGDVAGQDNSDRIREKEFQAAGLDAAALQELLERTLDHSRATINNLTLFDLKKMRLSARDGRFYSVAWALNHALEHTALHLGHVQIGRQLWEQRIL